MKSYKEKIIECIEYLNSIRFPAEDWKEDKIVFDQLESKFSRVPEDEETKVLYEELKKLIYEKRMTSLNCNKTTDELFAGWDDD